MPIDDIREVWKLVVAYARQETLEPIRGLGRFLAWGLAAAVFISTGLFLALLGALRLLQTETGSAFDGNWSWVPYVITLLGCALAAYAAIASRNQGREGRTP